MSTRTQAIETSGVSDRYSPIPGGWQIRLRAAAFYHDIQDRNETVENDGATAHGIAKAAGRLSPTAPIGLLLDNPRLHRRPLYPPAAKSLLWNETEREKLVRLGFHPLVLAFNVPRFLFELHWAGGFSGHLFVGLVNGEGLGKWLNPPAAACSGPLRKSNFLSVQFSSSVWATGIDSVRSASARCVAIASTRCSVLAV